MGDTRRTLRDLLEIHRGHVASLERQKALVRFDSAIELQLREERRTIAQIKRRLARLGEAADEDPLDGSLDDEGEERRAGRPPPGGPPPGGAPRRARRTHGPDGRPVLWLGGLLALTLGLAVLAAWILGDVLASLAVFFFTLLVLALALPYVGLHTRRLSEATWFRSYLAALRRIPALSLLLPRPSEERS
jgi:hypothetical protein